MELILRSTSIIKKRYSDIENIRMHGLCDNELKIFYSRPILKAVGTQFQVSPPSKKSLKMKSGSCYGNARRKSRGGYEYVEGIITHKNSGVEISHAWNVDKYDKHYDFTILETDEYIYTGVTVPYVLHFQAMQPLGRFWYCALPFIKVKR